MNRQNAPTVVSLFAGAGGMDVGLERAGWQTTVATDIEKNCIETLTRSKEAEIPVKGQGGSLYLAGANIIAADIRDLGAADLRAVGTSRNWRPDLLAGGAPCQPWSSSGLQRGLADDRGQLIDHFIRLADEMKPHLILFENVRGLITAIGPSGQPGEVLFYIRDAFEELGYATNFATLNAADYGAAQRRVRLFMLASRRHTVPSFPRPTHSRTSSGEIERVPKPWVALREFLEGRPGLLSDDDVVRPNPRRAEELSNLKPGTGLRTGGRIENNRPSGHWGYRQDCFVADPDLPSRTIRAASTPDWIRLPDGSHRRLTWRECAALQGFPKEWQFHGTAASKFRLIGNAVQADVAEVLGRSLRATIDSPSVNAPDSAPLPAEFARRISYTRAEHRTNGELRIRVRATVR